MYRHGQYGAPPPMLIPIKLELSFSSTTLPVVMVIPLYELQIVIHCLIFIRMRAIIEASAN